MQKKNGDWTIKKTEEKFREDGEQPLDAAKREAREELGVEAEKWTDLQSVDLDTSIVKNVVNLFLAENLKIGKPEREGTEQMQTVKMKLAEAVEKVMSGEITHAISCALILKAFLKTKNI